MYEINSSLCSSIANPAPIIIPPSGTKTVKGNTERSTIDTKNDNAMLLTPRIISVLTINDAIESFGIFSSTENGTM